MWLQYEEHTRKKIVDGQTDGTETDPHIDRTLSSKNFVFLANVRSWSAIRPGKPAAMASCLRCSEKQSCERCLNQHSIDWCKIESLNIFGLLLFISISYFMRNSELSWVKTMIWSDYAPSLSHHTFNVLSDHPPRVCGYVDHTQRKQE